MKKGLQTTALLISAILLARSVASAKAANLLTGMYLDSASTNSVSDGDSSAIPPTHEPDDIPETNPPMDAPVDIPETNSPMDAPVDIPETNSPMDAPVDIPETNPPMDAPVDIPETNPPMDAPVDIPETNPPMDAPVDIPETNSPMDAPVDIPETNPPMDAPVDIPETNPPMDAPVDIPETNSPMDAPVDIPETNSPMDAPVDIPETDPPIEFSPDTDLQDEVPTSVLSITAPNSLDFIIDPYELAGKGSIWSQEYDFVNEGNVPVKISLSKLHCRAADDVTIAESEESISDDGKTAALWLYLGDGHRIQITESDTSYEFTLEPEEALIFWIKGKISANNKWRNGDLGLSVLYRLEAAGSEE